MKTHKSIATEQPFMELELNDRFVQAFECMNRTEKNVFVTGKAGTGKSTLLKYFRENTRKKIAVLAPTGVAAVNIEGQTIHSFFGFKPDIVPAKIKKVPENDLFRELDAIVIDEISMVRADLLDCVDRFLRLNGKNKNQAFGGTQMLFFGDLYQLPPVVLSAEKNIFAGHYKSQYFFDANSFHELDFEFVELEKIYRQQDQKFIQLLNAIRNNSITEFQLRELNKRFRPDFEPPAGRLFVQLTTTNALADQKNQAELAKLPGSLFHHKAVTKGNFEKQYLPTETDLFVKTNAQIMMLNNDSSNRWLNGTMGKILEIKKTDKKSRILVELANGKKELVEPHTWKIFKLEFNSQTKNLDYQPIGSFTQYPLRLAWAVTIHKSQGKTFDHTIIDFGSGTFAHGQAYVALSRCTSLQGIVLKKPVLKKHVLMDWKVVKFLTRLQYELSEKKIPLEQKIRLIENAIQNKTSLDITYLKASDEKSHRTIQPKFVGELDYQGKPFLGVQAYCNLQQDNRTFRLDRILEISPSSNENRTQ